MNDHSKLKEKVSGHIDQCEFAQVYNKEGNFQEYCHGTYEEIEAYCEQKEFWVNKYLDHVNPATVRAGFRYVGKGTNPYELQRGYDYDTHQPIIDNSF